jgi:secreted trypsin-like serine protease
MSKLIPSFIALRVLRQIRLGFAIAAISTALSTSAMGDGLPSQADRIKAAEAFAGALTTPGTTQFEDLRNNALALAMALPRPKSADRQMNGSADVEDDPRYQNNLQLMVNQTISGEKKRIFGGRAVLAANFPDAVSVQGNSATCTGTLIASNVVLTAEHCYCNDVDKQVVFGTDALHPAPGQVYDVVKVVPMRSECNQDYFGADVALLYLDKIPSVAPRSIAATSVLAASTDVTAVGFGLTEDGKTGSKLLVDLPIASPSCSSTSGGIPDTTKYSCVATQELVAGMQNLHKDTCEGDSGGPIYIKAGQNYLLAGTTSRGVHNSGSPTKCGNGGIYERLDGNILSWLRQNSVPIQIGQ